METKTNPREVSHSKPILINRTFNQPLKKIWQAWSEPDTFKKWWGPSNYSCPECKMDFQVGGKLTACMRSQDGKDTWSTGTYCDIVPEKSLVVTDNFSDEHGHIRSANEMGMPGEWPNECLLTVQFEEADGGTALKLKHEGIPAEMYDDCIKGWNESLDKIDNI